MISYSDEEYSGIDIPFYNKLKLRKMSDNCFKQLILKGVEHIPNLIKDEPEKLNTKKDIDNWITSNNILMKCFENRKQQQDGFVKHKNKRFKIRIGQRGGKYNTYNQAFSSDILKIIIK